MHDTKNFFRSHLKQVISWFSVLSLCFLLFATSVTVFATEPDETETPNTAEDFGWVHIIVEVPEGFSESIVVSVENLNQGLEFAALVTAAEGYETQFQVPSGEYIFAGAFLENGDYRYSTSLVSSKNDFVVSSVVDTLPLLELKTTLIAEETEPSTETTAPNETTEATKGTDSATEPSEDDGNTEPSEVPTGPSDPDSSEEPASSTGRKLLLGFFSTLIFGSVVFLGVFLYRKYYVAI